MSDDPSQPLLPPQRAFVVQFSQGTDPVQGHFTGRVEHVISGHVGRFSSAQELMQIITLELTKLQAGAAETPGSPRGYQEGDDHEGD